VLQARLIPRDLLYFVIMNDRTTRCSEKKEPFDI
jgi:hypothetical protein